MIDIHAVINTAAGIITHTPVWVYVLLLFLLNRGIKALQPRRIKIPRLFFPFLVFFVWGSISVYKAAAYPVYGYGFMLLGIIGGVLISWPIWSKNAAISYCPQNRYYVIVSGSPLLLVFILLSFSIKFYLGYQSAVNPQLKYDITFNIALGLLTGLIEGWFISRALVLLMKLKQTETQ